MTAPLGVILAGGRASRMGGGDKSLRPLAGRRVIDHVLERLRPQVAHMALSANGDPARFSGHGMPGVADSIAGHAGPLAGVLAGLDWAADQGSDSIVTAAADTPFLPRDLVARLQSVSEGMVHPLALAATPDPARGTARHPTFGLWPVALRDDLRAALTQGVRKVVIWTDRHGARVATFPDDAAFFNVNTPDDLIRAKAML